MRAKYYSLVKREGGWRRYGAKNNANGIIYWHFTEWGARWFINANSADKITELE